MASVKVIGCSEEKQSINIEIESENIINVKIT